jgi:hypothetical protein
MSLPRHGRYWALERECWSASLLAIIQRARQRRLGSGRRHVVRIHPEPKTYDGAIENLKIFSGECPGGDGETLNPNLLEPFALDVVRTTWCFGWLEMPRQAVLAILNRQRVQDAALVPQLHRAHDLDDSERCFAVVYDYVPNGDPDPILIQKHLDFSYLAGFALMPFREENRRGNVLVDHSDLIRPQSSLWWKANYQRMEVGWYFEQLQKWSRSDAKATG